MGATVKSAFSHLSAGVGVDVLLNGHEITLLVDSTVRLLEFCVGVVRVRISPTVMTEA
jgi:hypothetical protein